MAPRKALRPTSGRSNDSNRSSATSCLVCKSSLGSSSSSKVSCSCSDCLEFLSNERALSLSSKSSSRSRQDHSAGRRSASNKYSGSSSSGKTSLPTSPMGSDRHSSPALPPRSGANRQPAQPSMLPQNSSRPQGVIQNSGRSSSSHPRLERLVSLAKLSMKPLPKVVSALVNHQVPRGPRPSFGESALRAAAKQVKRDPNSRWLHRYL